MRRLLAAGMLVAVAGAAWAADKQAAEAALAAAQRAEAEAGRYGNRWLPAEAALKAACQAIAAGTYDAAVAAAGRAHALAVRAIEQSKEQETSWRDAVVR